LSENKLEKVAIVTINDLLPFKTHPTRCHC